MTIANLDEVNLSSVEAGGQVHEALLQRLIDISAMDLVMTNAFGEGPSLGNHLEEWVEETLAAADPDNASVDGADITQNDARTGLRVGNYHQQPVKRVSVSDRANSVNAVGSGRNNLRVQLPKRLREIRRDVDAALSSNNPAVAGDALTIKSKLAGAGGWIGAIDSVDNSSRGGGGADPVLNGGTNEGGVPTVGPVAGTIRALPISEVNRVLEAAWQEGGNPTKAIGRGPVIRIFSDWMFDASARVAVLQSDVGQGNRTSVTSGGGMASGGVTAQGSVNVYVGNFATLTMCPSRYQPISSAGGSDLFLIDPDLWEVTFLQGYNTKEMARTGLAENRLLSCDVTLRALSQRGNAVVADISESLAAVA